MKLVLATRNQGKVKELREILGHLRVEVLSLQDFPEIGEIVENGQTFAANALIKARTVAGQTQLMAVADDSGLEVDYLQGAPGIFSARFAGEDTNDLKNNLKLLSLLEGVPNQQRTARFRCVIAVVIPSGEEYTAEGTCEGLVGYEMQGENGFGYDPLFFLPKYGRTFAQLESETKNRISHRGRALEKVKDFLADSIKKVR